MENEKNLEKNLNENTVGGYILGEYGNKNFALVTQNELNTLTQQQVRGLTVNSVNLNAQQIYGLSSAGMGGLLHMVTITQATRNVTKRKIANFLGQYYSASLNFQFQLTPDQQGIL